MTGGTTTRRGFLGLLGAAALGVAAGCAAPGAGAAGRGNAGTRSWANRLHVPPLDSGTVSGDGVRRFRLTAGPGRSTFLPGRPTTTWGFNGAYLGPTLRARSGERVEVAVRNELPETTSVHWHGMRLPAAADGGPHQPVEPGATWATGWQIEQPAATLWYHPHPHGATAAHVYRGLAGLWIVDDEHEPGLPNSYGVDDVPLVIQDRNLAPDGSLAEDPIAIWGLMGNDILVNGTFDPYIEVRTRLVRLRVLNASNARMYHLHLDDGRSFAVVGNDCALLPAPVAVAEVSLSPGERAELVVELAPDETVILQSRSGDNGVDEGDFDILQLRAAATLRDNGPLPASLPGPAPIAAAAGAVTRRFVLSGNSKINGQEMDMGRVDEVVAAGTTEIWEVDNNVYPHNFHIHDAAFTVLDVDGQPPPAEQAGSKDTVFVPNRGSVRLAVAFGDHPDPDTPYMYHCHMLRHEDEGMMGQFTLVQPGTEASAPRRVAALDERFQGVSGRRRSEIA